MRLLFSRAIFLFSIVFSTTFASIQFASAEAIYSDYDPFQLPTIGRTERTRPQSDLQDPFEGIGNAWIVDEGYQQDQGTMDSRGAVRGYIEFQSLDNPVVRCLINNGVITEGLLANPSLTNGIRANELAASEGNNFTNGSGVRLYGDQQSGYVVDLNLFYREGSNTNELVANVRQCFPADHYSENKNSNNSGQPRVIPASAPAPVSYGDDGIEI